jgi:hypothetical protein
MNISIGPNRPWAERFAELALRALRRVHYEYGAIHLGQQWRVGAPKLSGVNQGIGVAAADELTVCAAIAQECLLSAGFSGSWVETSPTLEAFPGRRFWRLDREQRYANSRERVDFLVKRIPENEGDAPLPQDNSRDCFIEAKRVRRWTTATYMNPSFESTAPLIGGIEADIAKLKAEHIARPGKIFAHLLLWDISSKDDPNSSTPQSLLLDPRLSCLSPHQVRWMPIEWLSADPFTPPQVKSWLWIALMELPLDA